MKTAILAFCLLGAVAFAAPVSEFIDPDCIEEDIAFEEPSSDINAEFALGLPDLSIEVGNNNNDEECLDDLPVNAPTAAPTAAPGTDECVEELEPATEGFPVFETTEAEPEATTAEECNDPMTEEATEAPATRADAPTTAADDCAETEPTEEVPVLFPGADADECEGDNNDSGAGMLSEAVEALDIHIEPAMQDFDSKMIGDYGEEQAVAPIEECEEY